MHSTKRLITSNTTLLFLFFFWSSTSAEKYVIVQRKSDGTYYATNGESLYPCDFVRPVLVCTKDDGIVIDHSEFDYEPCRDDDDDDEEEGKEEEAEESEHEEEQNVPEVSVPDEKVVDGACCSRTPDNFDGPGGFLCPPPTATTRNNATNNSTPDETRPPVTMLTRTLKVACLVTSVIFAALLGVVVVFDVVAVGWLWESLVPIRNDEDDEVSKGSTEGIESSMDMDTSTT